MFLHFAEISTAHFHGSQSAHRRFRNSYQTTQITENVQDSDEDVEAELSDDDIAAYPDYINSNDEGEKFCMICYALFIEFISWGFQLVHNIMFNILNNFKHNCLYLN